MCVSIIFHNYFKDTPLIIANNRDEQVTRNFSPPLVLNHSPYIIGGKDLEKGGTWLGINENRIFVNILNKFVNKETFLGSNNYRSRGMLILDLLKMNSINKILDSLTTLNINDYLPFYLVVSDIKSVFFAKYDRGLNITDISDKLSIVGNLDPFSEWDKYNYAYERLNNIKEKQSLFNTLKEVLKAQQGSKSIPSTDFSVNLGNFQTTSSTIVEFSSNDIGYFFANGSPLNSNYKNYSFLTRRLKNV